MKKYNFILIGIVIIIIAFGGWLAFQKEVTIAPVENIANQDVFLAIDSGAGNPNTFTVKFNEGATAFDLLKKEAEKSNINLETKSYDIGIMIEAIGDKKNGQDGKYWLYYVNGEMPMVSADKMFLKAGDKVEFKFEKSSF